MITRLIRVSSTIQDRFIRDAGARNLLIRIPPAARRNSFNYFPGMPILWMGHNYKRLGDRKPCVSEKFNHSLVDEDQMKKKAKSFKSQLRKYLGIKGLDIVVYLRDGKSIELNKNRVLVKDDIVLTDKNNREVKIPISQIISVDLFAA